MKADPPAAKAAGFKLEIAGNGLLTVTLAGPETPAALETVTLLAAPAATSELEIDACNWLGETIVVGRALPSHCTTEPERKLFPFTVKVKPGPPAVTELGLTDVIEGGWTGVGVGFGVGFGVPPPPPQPVNKKAPTTDKDRTTVFSLFLLLSHIVCSRERSA